MITDNFKREMESIVGRQNVSASRTIAELYSYDASLAKGNPGVVVFPADGNEVARVVRAARLEGISFVPRGFGTNLSLDLKLTSGSTVVDKVSGQTFGVQNGKITLSLDSQGSAILVRQR